MIFTRKRNKLKKQQNNNNIIILIINDNLSESEAMLEVLKRGELRLVEGGYNRGRKPDVNSLRELMPAASREGEQGRKELKIK